MDGAEPLRYERLIDPEGEDSLARIVRLIAPGSRVLDLGTGGGSLGQYLTTAKNCVVDGVEYSTEQADIAAGHYRRLHVADLEEIGLAGLVAGEQYDHVVCADVLEHLRDPGRVLDQLPELLAPDGSVLISIPNVAYMGLVADLLAGEFEYRPEGLLDETHVRFFTRKSLWTLLRSHGLDPVRLDRVTDLRNSEFKSRHLQAFPPRIRGYLQALPEGLTYQFIVEAVPAGRNDSIRRELGDFDSPATRPAPELHFSVGLFWREEDSDFDDARNSIVLAPMGIARQEIAIDIPAPRAAFTGLRLDPGDRPGVIRLYSIGLYDHDGGAVWIWDGHAATLEAAGNRREIVFADRDPDRDGEIGSEEGGVTALLTGEDPQFELPIPVKRLARLDRGGVCRIAMSWPESADYLALVPRFPDRERYQDLVAVHRTVEAERDRLWETQTALNQELGRLQQALRERDCRIGQYEAQIGRMREELAQIYGSSGWRLLTRYWRTRDRLLGPGSRARGVYDRILGNGSSTGIDAAKTETAPESKRPVSRATLRRSTPAGKIEGVGEQTVEPNAASVSVIIPTKDAGEGFRRAVRAIRNQQGFREVEIVVVDSGSTDGTVELARGAGAKVIRIRPEEFTHAYARNLGAEQSSGQYLLFTVQDALPPSDSWLHELFSVLESNDVVAVSCAEFPSADADLFYRAISWNHYRFLEVDGGGRIMGMPESGDHASLRKNGQLSDLACLIGRKAFLKYKYVTDYAEDLDLGLRLIRDGHKIAFLGSTRVIHSHNRPPYYYLKRGYVENVFLPRVFPDTPLLAVDPDTLLAEIPRAVSLVDSIVGYELDRLDYPCSVREFTSRINHGFAAAAGNGDRTRPSSASRIPPDPEFASFLDHLPNGNGSPGGRRIPSDGKLIEAMRDFTGMVLSYMDQTYEYVDSEIRDDFGSSLYKLCAYQCGAQLAHCYLQTHGEARDRFATINSELVRGV